MSAAVPALQVGVGLWTMQEEREGTAPERRYADFAEDAALVERHGLHSVWTAQHRATADGWCPAPLHALAFVAGRTGTVRLGTAVLLLPQQDPEALVAAARTLDELSGGRLLLGAGLGYREAEFELVGVPRSGRARLMERGLDALAAGWPAGTVLVGGMAVPALDRAARRGLGLLLPQTVPVEKVRAIASRRPGSPLGVLRDVRIVDGPDEARSFREQLREHYRQEIEAWWELDGGDDAVERQLGFADRAALVGDAAHVRAGLERLRAAGATLVVARLRFPFAARADVHRQIEALAACAP